MQNDEKVQESGVEKNFVESVSEEITVKDMTCVIYSKT